MYVKNKHWRKVFATKEVILSAGIIDFPKINAVGDFERGDKDEEEIQV